LKNAIIGKDQIEGVHCEGACTVQNVWWTDVCEDALSFKGNGNGNVIGGGAQGADDKVGPTIYRWCYRLRDTDMDFFSSSDHPAQWCWNHHHRWILRQRKFFLIYPLDDGL